MNTNEEAKNEKLWDNIKMYAKKVGREGSKMVLNLYYVMTSKETSRGTKILIGAALAYTVLPVGLVSSKEHPGLGWIDEAAALVLVYKKVQKNITPEIEQKTEETLNKWFADDLANPEPCAPQV